MEAGKVLETLEGDPVEFNPGDSQSHHDQTLEQASVLTTLNVKCTGSELGTECPEKANRSDFVANGESLEARNLGKESEFEHWNDGFAAMGAEVDMESQQGDAASLKMTHDVSRVSVMEMTHDVSRVSVMEMTYDVSRVSVMEITNDGNKSEEAGAEGIVAEDSSRKNDLTAQVDGGDSQNGNVGSQEGISLIVEVFGPLNGISQVDNASYECEHNLEEGARNDHEESTDNQEHKFSAGDLVWAKTKTQLWWPGIVSSKGSEASGKRDFYNVKYFGSIISVWCYTSQLKPFIEYFEQMSQQNKSRSFLGAVEKALHETGQRIKREMSCSCSSLKEREKTVKKDNRGSELGFFSASVFEPAKFLESIRYQAVDVSMPDSIEFAVMKNCLSAFYSSVGHKQMSLHKLRPRNEANDGNDPKDGAVRSSALEAKGGELVKISGDSSLPLGCDMNEQETNISAEDVDKDSKGNHEKSFELRERKKSKYLSYPYINRWDKKDSTSHGETETEDLKGGDSCTGAHTKNDVSEDSAGLKQSSRNPRKRKPRKSRTFKSIYGKVESVDKSSTEMLQELQLTALDCLYPNESKDSIHPVMNFFYSFRKHSFKNHDFTSEEKSQQQPQQKSQMEETMNKETSGHQENDASKSKGSEGDKLQLGPSSSVPKGRIRKPKEVKRQNCPENGSVLTNEQNMVEGGKVCRKRKKKETTGPGDPEIRVIGGLPDLNGNNVSLSVENMEVTGPDTSKGKLKPKRAKNKKVFVPEASADIIMSSELQNINMNSPKFIPVLKDALVVGPCPVENNVQSAGFSFTIPDLNGNAADPNSAGKGLANSSAVISQGKPRQRRRRRTKSTENMLLLNFNPGHPLPSKESLNATFIQFGPVVEPGIQYTSNSSAQVVFAQSRDAEGAYQSLEKSSPFGPALVSYHLNSPLAASNSARNGSANLSAGTSQGKPPRKRRRTTPNAAGRADGSRSTLLLNFNLGYPLPSTESLNDTFIRFGPVVERETRFLSDSSAQVVFSRSCDAELACQSLEKSSPFGPALASYHLHCPSVANNGKMPNTFLPMDAFKFPVLSPPNGEAPDLMTIKKNLEMMTAMLETAGDDISPEMKAQLESEVKGFHKKVSSMVGGSSS